MIKKIIIISVFVSLIALGGFYWFFPDDWDNLKTSINAKPMEIVPLVGEIGTSLSNKGSTSSSYISPAKLEINNAFRGASPEFVLKIRNGTSNTMKYVVSARNPDILEEGYSLIPLSWVSFEKDKEIVVKAGEIKSFSVVVKIPKKLPSKKLMFWLGVRDNSSSGMMKVELCSKILLNIR